MINILLADDDNDDCLFFQEALEELQLPVKLAMVQDGEQLMKLLTKKGYTLPDVLFLDLNMPRKNGFACLDEIKGNEKIKHLPVIIFSTFYEERVGDQLYKKGALYYIRKPASFKNLQKVIQLALDLISPDKTTLTPQGNFLLTNPNNEI